MAGLDATEKGNELSQPTFELTSLTVAQYIGRAMDTFDVRQMSISGCV